MKTFLSLSILLQLFICTLTQAYWGKNIQEFGVLPTNSAAVNTQNLQKAIEWASPRGAALFIEPSEVPYPINGGIVLQKNVSLIGVHGPTPRSTVHPKTKTPVGSVFNITDTSQPFITVQSATQIKGIQFWYSEQVLDNPEKIIHYPPTIQVDRKQATQGVTLSNLTFYGEYIAMDFNASEQIPCELILIEHCYGYPLSGKFIQIDYCYDIPRILHCHVNPAITRETGKHISKSTVDYVVAQRTFAYAINHTDNAQLMDIFTFGSWGGIYLGPESYGQLTNFNLDCVAVGIHKLGNNSFNRNWMIAQGSIIANTGDKLEDVHPFIIEGEGHTAISNVEAFSGDNVALTTLKKSHDFMLVRGNKPLSVSLTGARMRNYETEQPISVTNSSAVIQTSNCIDKYERPYTYVRTK